MRRNDWTPNLIYGELPLFEAIAQAIADDIADGKLHVGDHLPTQRALAKKIGMDVTTIARGYTEAARLGLVEARVGSGTFVKVNSTSSQPADRRADLADRSMNQPPDVEDPELLSRMRASVASVTEMLPQVLRYLPTGGVDKDKAAGADWLARRNVVTDHHTLHTTAGAHAAVSAVLSTLLMDGGSVACESITYPGIRGIAKSIGKPLHGLPTDSAGILPTALADAAAKHHVRVLYLNPTLRNPTTETVPLNRRMEIVEVARKHGIMILEDDAYGILPVNPPPALAMLAPELTFYVASLAKSLGPALRLAYLLTPKAVEPTEVSESLRAVSVMASPLTTAIATRWIETGLADAILASIRSQTRARRKLLTDAAGSREITTAEFCFHAWIKVPPKLGRQRAIDLMRGYSLAAVPSDPFCFDVEPPEAFRLCLGGPGTLDQTKQAIEALSSVF